MSNEDERKKLLTESLRKFQKQYPQSGSGDLQTFVLGQQSCEQVMQLEIDALKAELTMFKYEQYIGSNVKPKTHHDYLHLYLKSGIGFFVFTDDSITDGFLARYISDNPNGVYNPVLSIDNYEKVLRDGYKPILRPASDMTTEESEGMQSQKGNGIVESWSYMIKYLIDKGFDVFGLIESGFAIDKTKLDKVKNEALCKKA